MPQLTFPITYAGASDVGLIREQNEDVWGALPEKGLFLLADGMGGQAAGEIAAKMAVDTLQELVEEWTPPADITEEGFCSFFTVSIQHTNRLIYQAAEKEVSWRGMGTTLTLLYLYQDRALIAHVGDSRVYLLRSGELRSLTKDHSLLSELFSLGVIENEEAKGFPYKHILTKALGTSETIDPTLSTLRLESGDLFLLCSDGLTNMLSDHESEDLLRKNRPLNTRAQDLVDLANVKGGIDNTTVILVQVDHDLPR